MGAISILKTEDGKLSCETPEGTVINININQRSALDCMLDAIKAVQMKRAVAKKTASEPAREPAQKRGSPLPLGLGVSIISLGFISVVVAVILAVVQPQFVMFYTGAHFWVGFPLIVSGVLNVVAYRYPKPFWMAAAFVSLLACLAVSIAGLVFAVNDIQRFPWWSNECDYLYNAFQNRDNYQGYKSYYRTEPPRYYDNYNNNWQLDECKRALRQYKNMTFGLLIMSLLMMVWGICASVISLGYRLKTVFVACKCETQTPEEEDKDEPLLSPNPPNDVFIA